MSFVVAVDGPVASGKGTLAKKLAQNLGYTYLDTGSLYRATGRKCLRNQQDPKEHSVAVSAARSLDDTDLNDPHLRDEVVGEAASIVAANQEVRKALLEYQREFALKPPGSVLDGRDIGTVVCPDAQVKLFITASAEIRAHRRYLELKEKGVETTEAEVLADLQKRDARDQARTVAPLKPADDAVVVDTSEMNREQAFEFALGVIKSKLSK